MTTTTVWAGHCLKSATIGALCCYHLMLDQQNSRHSPRCNRHWEANSLCKAQTSTGQFM